MALNSHRVFTGPADAGHYLAALTLEAEREAMLRSARDTCREAIRAGLRNWATVLHKSRMFDAAVANVAPGALKPKFKMQGSFAYRTLNDPAHSPPQKIDLDDGVFVPVSFLNDSGGAHPALISSGYFAAVEALLAPVCDTKGWMLVTDKPSCVRVELNGGAHIDFALYAIPDKEFEELVEREMLAKAMDAPHRAMVRDQVELAEYLYRGLQEDEIMLAHRKEGWRRSDPRKLEDWFRSALRQHGEQLRRVCRYLKGWRDFHWEACRLSSIALMACMVTAYDGMAQAPSDDRDDLALLAVAERLPDLFRGRIANPVVDGQFLDDNWSPENRNSFIAEARALLARLREAITGTDSPRQALAALTRAFGDRLPDDHGLIRPEAAGKVAAPAVFTSGLIRQMGNEREPQQAVKREGDRRYG